MGKTTIVRRYEEDTKKCREINELSLEIGTSLVVYVDIQTKKQAFHIYS